ncbi:methyl-accepting chemotaxis protein [Aquabacterium parvum]|jgi:aerotaxis receptor|uniref:methyl-accepting chemotaxis protein n=2 Tax=Aquabacterium TaxID=92793 RepID=UPI000718FFD8|nr:PAS domain-containing methyl-accepting chemotaxis protein [Aquabacterium parvum]MBU0916283.1 PAS domain-containing protein [Gammaproteobacteria bacterium]
MRPNLPVTEQEFAFPKGDTLVSTTDLKGRITYCNPGFIHVSGYTREELLGQPHNMIRHPDMPEEAFRDMWETIASGRPWTALVKNRRKDGSFYWVQANVTPLMEDGRPVGYMSVRTEPEREAVAQASELYRVMRQEKEAGRLIHTLRNGRVLKNTWGGRTAERLKPGLSERLAMIAGSVALIGFGMGMWAGGSGQGLLSPISLGCLLVLGTLIALASMKIRSMTMGPIKALMDSANRMAAGDLTQVIHSDRHDLIGQFTRSLNQLNVNLRSIVKDARMQVDEMLLATREIAAGNQDLSSRTESQASSLQQTAASMEEITGTVKHSSDTAGQAADLATQTTAITQRSSQVVSDVTQTMQAIEDSSRRIGEIIQVIDSIAFQTNILALNAAVEAARAGEQGRGFAVVASEVRALAGRTATAAREVKQLITDSADKVRAGSELTHAAQNTMQEAVQSVEQVTTLVTQISGGAREQLSGISQINSAVAQLDSITQQNAAAVEQIAAASMSLAQRAKSVAEAVQVFHTEVGGKSAHSHDAVALRKEMKGQAARQDLSAPA